MKTRLPAALLLAAAIIACGRTDSSPPAPASADFDAWSERFAEDWVRASPQIATRSQYFMGAEQDALDRQLAMIGEWDWAFGGKALAARAAQARQGLEALGRFDSAALTPRQRTSAAVIRWSLEDVVTLSGFPGYRYVFDQFNGFQLDLINALTQSHPIRRAGDVENYIARLPQVAPRVDEAIAEARAAEAAGILPPRFIVQRMIEQLDGFVKQPARENVFVTTLGTRMALMPEPVAQDARSSSMAAAEKAVAESIIPAYQRIRALLAEQLPKTNDDAGVWRLPGGNEYYATQLATYTNTRLTADEIHAIGLREVARIEGEMDTILRQLGYANGTVNERYRQLEAAVQPKAPGDPRPQILAEAEKWVRDAEKRATLVFDKTPRARVEVRREPAFSEKTAAAHYTDPAPDGSRPGIYYLPLPGAPYELVRMRSLAYHEAVPGHHFQIAMQQELTSLPKYRRLMIIELREKARAALGDRFSLKAFHNLVLETGSVPLEVLGQEVDAWIAAQRP